MTARERDPQGASMPAARLEAIRERLAKLKPRGLLQVGIAGNANIVDYDGEDIVGVATVPDPAYREFFAHAPEDMAWLLARLAPATPPGAATAGDAREDRDAMRGQDVRACQNIIEVWLRVNDLRGSPPPITWAHLNDLAEAFAELLAAERLAVEATFKWLARPATANAPPSASAGAGDRVIAIECAIRIHRQFCAWRACQMSEADCGAIKALSEAHAAPPAAGSREATPHER